MDTRVKPAYDGKRSGQLPDTPDVCYGRSMTDVKDIEKAIERLAPAELAQFRAWFDDFDAARFDEKIERDAHDGKLDKLAEQALAAHRAGRTSGL
jgi:hypothetical protein